MKNALVLALLAANLQGCSNEFTSCDSEKDCSGEGQGGADSAQEAAEAEEQTRRSVLEPNRVFEHRD
jgi:hypothetical protein